MRIVTDYDGTFPSVLPFITTFDEVLVITGQHPNFWSHTRNVIYSAMRSIGVGPINLKGYPGYKNPNQPTQFTDVVLRDIANWKADKVREFGADYYFDDDLRVIMIVKARCPDTICCLVV